MRDNHEPKTVSTREALNPDRVRRVLATLEDLRDVIEVGNGYWLPTPLRLVQLPEKDKIFIVGGVATPDLTGILGTEVKLSGFIRYVENSALPGPVFGDKTLWQPYEDWRGDTPEELKVWTEMILAKARQCLRPSASDFTNFEVYFPSAQVNLLQFFRWTHFDVLTRTMKTPPSDLVLCRSVPQRFQTGPTRYWFGSITPTALKNEAPILPQDRRRLMYGLDLIYGAPTQAVWKPGGIIVLKNWPPPEERRLLLTLGQDVSPEPGRLPLRYRVRAEWQDFITISLERLGIRVVRLEGDR